jgi:hypothetical protein
MRCHIDVPRCGLRSLMILAIADNRWRTLTVMNASRHGACIDDRVFGIRRHSCLPQPSLLTNASGQPCPPRETKHESRRGRLHGHRNQAAQSFTRSMSQYGTVPYSIYSNYW